MRQLAQVNPQLGPVRDVRRRRGLGDVSSAYISQANGLPGASGAWSQVQAQLQGEGLGTDDVGYAALSFVSAYQQFPLINPSGQVQDAVSAAAQFTLNNHSIGAAVGQVEDLVATITSGADPQQVFQAFGGTLMATASLAVGAGAVSFGVGAAIVAGIGILEAVIGFNQPPPPIAMVGSCAVQASRPPTIVDGYTWSWGQPTTGGPGLNGAKAPYWRRFPEPGVANDIGWFVPYEGAAHFPETSQVQWGWTFGGAGHTDQLYSCFLLTEDGKRPIDQIGNEPQGPPNVAAGGPTVYHQLESEAQWAKLALASNPNDTLARFQLALFAAWKSNREFGLNGLQQRSDAEVLAQVVRVWNRANNGPSISISPSSSAPIAWSAVGYPGMTPYAAIILGSAQGSMPSDVLNSSGGLTLSGYSPKTSRTGAQAVLHAVGGSGPAKSSPSATSTAIKYTAGAAVAGLLGAFLYARHKRTTTKAVLGKVWKKTGGTIRMPRLPQHLHLLHIGKR